MRMKEKVPKVYEFDAPYWQHIGGSPIVFFHKKFNQNILLIPTHTITRLPVETIRFHKW